MSMSGKTVLKTGATSGLGLATALLLAERGAEVVMVGRDRTRSNFMRTEVATCAAGNAPILLADLSSQAEIHRPEVKQRGTIASWGPDRRTPESTVRFAKPAPLR